MSMFVDPLALAEPIAGFNGGAYVAPDMHVLETHTLAADAASKAIEMLGQLGLDAWLYTGKSWYLRNPDAPHVARVMRTAPRADKLLLIVTFLLTVFVDLVVAVNVGVVLAALLFMRRMAESVRIEQQAFDNIWRGD